MMVDPAETKVDELKALLMDEQGEDDVQEEEEEDELGET